MTRSIALAASSFLALWLGACDRPGADSVAQSPASTPAASPPHSAADAATSERPPAPESAVEQPQTEEQASDDWRRYAKPTEVDKLSRLDAAWTAGLKRARAEGHGGELAKLGALAKPGGGLTPRVQPAPGAYRCRTIKLGGEANGLAYLPYPYFRCEVEITPGGDLIVRKLTGSQRFEGKLYPDRDDRLVYLGAAAWGDGETPPAYGANSERDQIGVVERVGPQQWRLAIAWPVAESSLDIIELVK